MHGAHGGVGETCRKVTRPDPTHSLHHHDSRPRSAIAGVRWAWTATESPLAIGNGLAQVVRSDGLEAIHGARRGERSSGHRDGQVPGANADRAQTDWTRGVAGA